MDNEITNQGMTELFCANPREVREGTSAVGRASSPNSRLPSQVLTTPTPLDINLDNEITNHRMTELFCANPREVTEGTSAVGKASSSNSRLPSQVLTTPTPLDINLDNEITNQVTTLLFFFLFLFSFFFSSFVAPLDINLDNEITNQGMTELFCANPREVREGTSAVGRASSPNSRLPSQVLTTPTPLDINLDNEITNQVTTLLFFSFFFFFFFSSFVAPLDINLDNEITIKSGDDRALLCQPP